ncbi:MAG: PIN domain-containing protein [Gaiella sp.]|nr:PIN domain-containing protein [Gaiella sp.]
MSLFVDTSAWYAAASTGDRSNARAKEILVAERLVLTDHVLVETWRLLAYRHAPTVAERWWDGIRSGVAEVALVGAGDLERAWEVGRRFSDQGFSLVDRTSFVVMERLGLTRAASFDDHFAIYRYGPRLDRAFDVVR